MAQENPLINVTESTHATTTASTEPISIELIPYISSFTASLCYYLMALYALTALDFHVESTSVINFHYNICTAIILNMAFSVCMMVIVVICVHPKVYQMRMLHTGTVQKIMILMILQKIFAVAYIMAILLAEKNHAMIFVMLSCLCEMVVHGFTVCFLSS